MAGVADVLGVVVWPVVVAFVIWRLERPLGALLEAATARLRRPPREGPP